MLGRMEIRSNGKPRDGRHCDLCGCSFPAVRCDKCGSQIFCLSCDDMYHRHPKRRFHLRKAVDPQPSASQARPVLPAKTSQMAPGDPSKMPLPPPRKKKTSRSFFDTFRRGSPSSENSPPLPKKEYNWTDKLGSIKKFMSNRPLPPLPNGNIDSQENSSSPEATSNKHDLTFIHKRVEEKPPQLPQRNSMKSQEGPAVPDKNGLWPSRQGHVNGEISNDSANMSNFARNRGFSVGGENHGNFGNPDVDPTKYKTLNTHPYLGYMQHPVPGYPQATPPSGMHQSASATDLHALPTEGVPNLPPHYPYPMNMPPHYPYPMYPQYPPQYPQQYFGNSWANLAGIPQSNDGDVSDHSEASSRRFSEKRYPFRKKAKRSQSVMVDRMGFPGGQFYPPFGPFPPGYGPVGVGGWGQPPLRHPLEPFSSPSGSNRSLNRIGRNRHRRRKTKSDDEEEDEVDDDEEEFSMSSSPVSRPKSSSSERPRRKSRGKERSEEEVSTSEEEEKGVERNVNQKFNRKKSDSRRRASTPLKHNSSGQKQNSKSKQQELSPEVTHSSTTKQESEKKHEDKLTEQMDTSEAQSSHESSKTSWIPSSDWECRYCTFLNKANARICQVCCKTAIRSLEVSKTAPESNESFSTSPNSGNRKVSESFSPSPNSGNRKVSESSEDMSAKKDKQEMANLNSALDEAEKEISRGLEELMKLKDECTNEKQQRDFLPESTQMNAPKQDVAKPGEQQSAKPVYKSTGKMRSTILDKLTSSIKTPAPKSYTAATSTTTETQTISTNTSDDLRRLSTSSTTSDAFNSPMAQSPEVPKTDIFNGNNLNIRRDSSCQTQQDSLSDYLQRKKADEEAAYLGRANYELSNAYQRFDGAVSPSPFMYRDRAYGTGLMHRSHSRASLFAGRYNDPMDYGNQGFGPTPMYRSVSRGSLSGDFPEGRFSEFQNLRKPDFYLSMEELVERRRQDTMRAQGLELVRMIREAEQQGFTADDIQMALNNCGKQNPLEWLQENYRNMVDNVVALSTNYGNDKGEHNDIGLVAENEARDALRLYKGNIWAAVTECVEGRQRKFLELSARGKFSRRNVVDALSNSQGDVEMAYANLTKSSSKPFLMRFWGAGEGVPNQDGALSKSLENFKDMHQYVEPQRKFEDDEESEEIWVEDDAEEDEEHEDWSNDEDLQTAAMDYPTISIAEDVRTPESEDKSEYVDAFASGGDDRSLSSPSSDDILLVIPDDQKQHKRRGTSFLTKLTALRKENKEKQQSNYCKRPTNGQEASVTHSDYSLNVVDEEIEPIKSYGPLDLLKSTFTAIKDTVTGSSSRCDKKNITVPEGRTIVIGENASSEYRTDKGRYEVAKLTSVKPLDPDETFYQSPKQSDITYVPPVGDVSGNDYDSKSGEPYYDTVKTRTMLHRQENLENIAKLNENEVKQINDVANEIDVKLQINDTSKNGELHKQDLERSSLLSKEREGETLHSKTDDTKVHIKHEAKFDIKHDNVAVVTENISNENPIPQDVDCENLITNNDHVEVKSAHSIQHTTPQSIIEQHKASEILKIDQAKSSRVESMDLNKYISEQEISRNLKHENTSGDSNFSETQPILSPSSGDSHTKQPIRSTDEYHFNSPLTQELMITYKDEIPKCADDLQDKYDVTSNEQIKTVSVNEMQNHSSNITLDSKTCIQENLDVPESKIETDVQEQDSLKEVTYAADGSNVSAGMTELEKEEIIIPQTTESLDLSSKIEDIRYVDEEISDKSDKDCTRPNINKIFEKDGTFALTELTINRDTNNEAVKEITNTDKSMTSTDNKDDAAIQNISTLHESNFLLNSETAEPNESSSSTENHVLSAISNDVLNQSLNKEEISDKNVSLDVSTDIKISEPLTADNIILEVSDTRSSIRTDKEAENTLGQSNDSSKVGNKVKRKKISKLKSNKSELSNSANKLDSQEQKLGLIDKSTKLKLHSTEDNGSVKQELLYFQIEKDTGMDLEVASSSNMSNNTLTSISSKDLPLETLSLQRSELIPVSSVTETNLTQASTTNSSETTAENSNEPVSSNNYIRQILPHKTSDERIVETSVVKLLGPSTSGVTTELNASEKSSKINQFEEKNSPNISDSFKTNELSTSIVSDNIDKSKVLQLSAEIYSQATFDADKKNEPKSEYYQSITNNSLDSNRSTGAVTPISLPSISGNLETPSSSSNQQNTADAEATVNHSNETKNNEKLDQLGSSGQKLITLNQSNTLIPTMPTTHEISRSDSAATVHITSHTSTTVKVPETSESRTPHQVAAPSIPAASSSKSIIESETKSVLKSQRSDDSDNSSTSLSTSLSTSPLSPASGSLLRNRFDGLKEGSPMRSMSPIRPQSPFGRMSFKARKEAIAQEKERESKKIYDVVEKKPWFLQKVSAPDPVRTSSLPKRSIKQQLEMERRVRKMVADRKCRTYRKAEIVVQLQDMNFLEEEALQAANECATLEQAISYLQQECLLCTGHYPVSKIISMVHCPHKACRDCIRAYFTVQIRDRTIMELLCPFCNEPDIGDEDVAQDYFNHLDIMLKKLVDLEIHELFQRKLRDRVLMKDPNFRWCSQCSSGFISMPNLKRLVCPDCNAVTCASCRRPWEREHQGMTCEAFAALKDATDPEAQAAGLAKLLTEDGIDCPSCHFRYALAKGGCMHFRCIQCLHDFCSGCSRPFKMGQKCGVSEFCAKLGLHAHHPRNCLFYLRDKDPEDLQRLLDMNDIEYNVEPSEGVEVTSDCQVMEQKETADGMFDDCCGKDVEEGYAGLCRIHYVEYLGQLVNKHKVDPIQIFEQDDLELVLRRASIRLPPKRYRESDAQYRVKLVQLIQEELPIDKIDGS